jgi:hypothetical protein
MPETMRATIKGTIGGSSDTFTQSINVEGDSLEKASPSVPVAKVGQLTTRTDNDTGVLTMAGGHGFATSDKLDVFWSGGRRRNMTATVSVNAVTVDGGSGDNLPTNLTFITAMKPVEVAISFDGADAVGLMVSSPVPGFIAFYDDAGTPAVITDATYEFEAAAGEGKTWVDGNGITNPFGSSVVTMVKFSHGSSSAAQTMKAAVVFN